MKIKTKDIGKYVIYSDGRVWTKRNKRFLKQSLNKDGYVIYSIDGKKQLAHRLVYECFNGDIPEGLEIDHLDGDRANNCLPNLEAVNHKENIRRAVKRGSYNNNPKRQGQNHGRSVLTEADVMKIRSYPKRSANGRGPGVTHKELSDMFGVSATRICAIRNHREWKHVQ